jgi:hypothetical protein
MSKFYVGDPITVEQTFGGDDPADPESVRLEILPPPGEDSVTPDPLVYVWPEPDEDEGELEHGDDGEFSVTLQTESAGTYNYSWQTTGPVDSAPGQIYVYPRFMLYLRPTLDHVAAVRASRTYVDGADLPVGTKAKAFTDDTDPTADDVDRLIDEAIGDVCAVFASRTIPQDSWEDARRAIVCKVALAIELSDFPEVTIETSPYIQLRRDSDNAMGSLVNAAQVRDLFGEGAAE